MVESLDNMVLGAPVDGPIHDRNLHPPVHQDTQGKEDISGKKIQGRNCWKAYNNTVR